MLYFKKIVYFLSLPLVRIHILGSMWNSWTFCLHFINNKAINIVFISLSTGCILLLDYLQLFLPGLWTQWVFTFHFQRNYLTAPPGTHLVLNVYACCVFLTFLYVKWLFTFLICIVYFSVIRNQSVKNFLGVPIIPVQPPSKNQKPALPFFEMLKKFAAAQQQPLPLPIEASKSTTQKMPSSLVLNQRLKSIEKEVKGRKKGKKSLKRWP